MKALQLALATAVLAGALSSCHPDPVYVPVYVPTETKAKPKTVYKKVTPKKETAEDFRAVEKPSSYSY